MYSHGNVNPMSGNYVENRSDEALIGLKQISRYMGICVGTLCNWRNRHAFPTAPLPDGRVMTTKYLIDQWLLARVDAKGRLNQSPGRPRKADTSNQELTPDSSKTSPNEAKTE